MNDLLIYGVGGAIIIIACQILTIDANDEKFNWRPFIIGSVAGMSALVALYFILSWIS